MTARTPLVIVTLPARTAAEVRQQLPPLAAAGADMAEVRFDRWAEPAWEEVARLFPSELPLVATYRSRTEGGAGADAPEERQRRLEALDVHPFSFLDLERARDQGMIERLRTRSTPPRPIVSAHLGARWTPEEVSGALRSPVPPGGLTKVVVPASVSALYATLRPMLPLPDHLSHATLHTTGGSGPVLRARAERLGLATVYAAPPTSPGSPSTGVEPSQIPVNALLPFLHAGGEGRLFGLLGHPVGHSLSPALHDGWYARERRAALFVPLDIDPAEDFSACVRALGEDGFSGFNVTVPWKRTALASAARASNDARAAGCANTLTLEGGEWSAENFDVSAVVRRIRELRASGQWAGDDLLVLGGGGAARAALVAAMRLGIPARALTRNRAQGEAISREMGVRASDREDRPASLIIHATTAGMAGASTALQLDWEEALRPTSYVLDMVYHPAYGAVRDVAERRGAAYEDGSRLLVYQAAEAHRQWWGNPPGPELEAWGLQEVLCAE